MTALSGAVSAFSSAVAVGRKGQGGREVGRPDGGGAGGPEGFQASRSDTMWRDVCTGKLPNSDERPEGLHQWSRDIHSAQLIDTSLLAISCVSSPRLSINIYKFSHSIS